MTQATNPLGTKPVGKLLLSMAIPSITAQLINALYNIVDRIYIGRIEEVGSLCLAALGVSFPLIMIISAFAALIGMGGAPKAAIKMGEGNYDEAENILGNAFTSLLCISTMLIIVFFLFRENLLTMFGATENSLPYAMQYFSIYLCGTFFVQLALGLNTFITAQGFAKASMTTVLIGAICNIILDPIFIFVFDLGVSGAALATIISQFISAVWVLKFLFSKKSLLKIKKKYLKLNSKIMLSILALGISPFIMYSTESLVQLTLNAGLKTYGGDNVDTLVASMSVITSIMQLVMLPLSGLAQGAQPIISYNYGAKLYDRVKKAFKLLFISALSFSFTIWLVIMLFPATFISLFSTDPELISFATGALRVFMMGIIFMGAQIACQYTLLGLGQAKTSLFLALLRKIILLIPLAIIFPIFMGYEGIFFAEPVADFIAIVSTCTVYFFMQKKLLPKTIKN